MMKTRTLFLGILAGFVIYASMQVSVTAASPTIDLITSFNIPEAGVDTNASDINNDGTIVGSSTFDDGGGLQGFVRFRNGDYSVIINPSEAQPYTVAVAINNSGLIAGYYNVGHESVHGFLLSGDTYTDFNVPGACDTYILGLNDAGDFAGVAYFPNPPDGCNDVKSFISIGSEITIFSVIGPGDFTSAKDINNLGQVVGSYSDGATHGFLRDADGTLTFPIDYPGAVATILSGINDKGWMTGSYDDTIGIFHALFLRSTRAEFVSFDGPSGPTYFGRINNRGFICGTYYDGQLAKGFVARVHRSSGE